MRRLLPAVLTLLLVLPAAAQREDRQDPPSITVAGSGEVRAEPDEAVVRLGVTRQASTASEAQEQVNRVAQAILRAITGMGIPRERIRTEQLSLFPVYAPQQPRDQQEPRIVGYRASNVVSVRVINLEQVGPVIDAGLKAGSNQVEGVSFHLRNELPARERALREAVAEARRKAGAIADALGVRLGNLLEAQEGGVSVRPPMPLARGGFAAAEAVATPVSPGEITVSASVTLRYRIAPQ